VSLFPRIGGSLRMHVPEHARRGPDASRAAWAINDAGPVASTAPIPGAIAWSRPGEGRGRRCMDVRARVGHHHPGVPSCRSNWRCSRGPSRWAWPTCCSARPW